MRLNMPVTQQERTFPPDARLISTTDLSSHITYCNDAFVALSGFTREELIGQPHNLVRHPDMPASVFAHMWQTLKDGRPWMGVVKNRSKNGDFYWVSAYVTPVYESGQICGFESVRSSRPAPRSPGPKRCMHGCVTASQRSRCTVLRRIISGVSCLCLSPQPYWACAITRWKTMPRSLPCW